MKEVFLMKNLKNKLTSMVIRAKAALTNKKAEGFIDSGGASVRT